MKTLSDFWTNPKATAASLSSCSEAEAAAGSKGEEGSCEISKAGEKRKRQIDSDEESDENLRGTKVNNEKPALSHADGQASPTRIREDGPQPTPDTKAAPVANAPSDLFGNPVKQNLASTGLATQSKNTSTATDFFGNPVKAESVSKQTEQESATDCYGKASFKGLSVPSTQELLDDCEWRAGGRAPFAHLAAAFDKIEATTKRLEITEILTCAFRVIIAKSPVDLLPCVYLAANKIAPAHDGIELGMGESIIMRALADACGRQSAQIKSDYKQVGDLGLVAASARSGQKTMFRGKTLTVQSVFDTLRTIALESGNQAMKRRQDRLKAMMVAAQGSETKYVVRLSQGKLRIGLAEATVVLALARAITLTPPQGIDVGKVDQDLLDKNHATVRRIYSNMPSYDKIIPVLLKYPVDELPDHCHLTPGLPVKPMLAHPTKGVSEVLDRFSGKDFTCEYKYDGERGQVHLLEDGTVKIFSRNSEDNTQKYPDIVSRFAQFMNQGVKSAILDCEVVAYDRETKTILPFQVLSTRARKGVSEEEIKIQVCLFGFDLMYLNGKSLLLEPFQKRRDLLMETFKVVEGRFHFATNKDLNDPEDILAFLNEAVDNKCEGLMVKTLSTDATYEPDRRCWKWLKVKKDYIQGMTDSLDLVPIGAFYGRGKRTGVYGAYLMACYNPDEETFQSICKIGTGFSDEQLQELHKGLEEHVVPAAPSYYDLPEGSNIKPDVFFDAKQVWEVQAADLSISPVHKAAVGMADVSKGIALRFPRFMRIRDDKAPEDATNADQVYTMFTNQAVQG